jgi:outer membrane protein OmpA-like peptidoglycan-associated protein
MRKLISLIVFAAAACCLAVAQEQNPTATEHWPQNNQNPGEVQNGMPVYKITVVGRDIPALNYLHRSSTRIGFQGTSLLPQAKGTAEINVGSGRTTIHAKLEGLVPANSFGVEYLTYVIWAITPDGRPVNLGEVLPDKSGKFDITVTTNLQSFGLIVTAEPYFAVTMPSDLVVAQNFILPDKTQGVSEAVNAHYSLLPRGAYTQTAGEHTVLHPITRNDRSPLELYEAINAVQIAQAAGAGKYAQSTLATAQQDLQNAQAMDTRKGDRKQEITYAREAVQASEDARIITIRKEKAEDEAHQREATQQAQQKAQQAALDAQQAAQQQAQAEAQAQAAQAAAQQAQAQQAQAQAQAAAAQQQTEQMRERLRTQLNDVLATRETARGLIVNMSDVLFDFGKYSLKQDAQVKLARVSGILLTYPGLKLQVEGYTDNIGSDAYNQKLSQQRADAVRDFLMAQGVQAGGITSTGYGKADPIADNTTNAGRAQNRRVQLVVSGAAIGVQQEQGPAAGSGGQPQGMNAPQPSPPPQQPRQTNNTGTSNVPPQS